MKKAIFIITYTVLVLMLLYIKADVVLGAEIELKLPFPAGEKWTITQGYHGDGWTDTKNPYSHRSGLFNGVYRVDNYAIDFSSLGGTYDKPIVAVASGTAHIFIQGDYKKTPTTSVFVYKSYGNSVLIDHGNGLFTRYGHLLDFSIKEGDFIHQGQVIGHADSTGYSFGSHLHFALYKGEMKNGKLVNYDSILPEPMSGYTDFKAGKEYTSDNELYSPKLVVSPTPPSPRPSLVIRVISWLGDVEVV